MLATEKQVAPATHRQALNALLFPYRLLGYEARVSCAEGERRKAFGLYKDGELVPAGTTLQFVSPLLASAYSHISGLSKTNLRALSLCKRHQAAELLLTHYLHSPGEGNAPWDCLERWSELKRFGDPLPDGHPNSPVYGHLKLPHLN